MDKKMVHSTVYLTKQQYETLRKLAFDTRRPAAEHIRQAIDEYLERVRTAK